MRPATSVLALLLVPLAAAAQQAGRIKVERSGQLPRHLYPVPAPARALLDDSARFAALARQLEADLRGDLAA